MGTRLVATGLLWLSACGRTGLGWSDVGELDGTDDRSDSIEVDEGDESEVDEGDPPPDVPTDEGCGDGVIEPGELCFFEQITFPSRIDPCSIASGDLDGDGHLDVAVPNSDFEHAESPDNVATVLYGDGNGGLSEPFAFVAGGNVPVGIAVGALSEPGARSDLIIANNEVGMASVLLRTDARAYSFSSEFSTGLEPVTIAVADLDEDGIDDIGVATDTGPIAIAWGFDGFGFSDSLVLDRGGTPWAIAFAHLNGDSRHDIVVSDSSSARLLLWYGAPGNDFVEGGSVGVGNAPLGLAAVDVDADGDVDLAAANSADGDVSVLLSDGHGGFLQEVRVQAGLAPRAIAAADFDSDGNLDLAILNSDSQDVIFAVSDGEGGFEGKLTRNVGTLPSGIVAGDFNEDGVPDLAVSNQLDNDVGLVLSNP